jgi:hypothetical protein
VNDAVGWSMMAVGGLLPAVMVSGSETSWAPPLSVTRRRTV